MPSICSSYPWLLGLALVFPVLAGMAQEAPLVWRAVDGQPLGEDFAALRPADAPKRTEPLVLRKGDGSGRTVTPRVLDAKAFFGGRAYAADLPGSLRGQATFVRFLLSGTAKADPESGTILNIDGAILGFRTLAGTPEAVEVVTTDAPAAGQRTWRPVGMALRIDARNGLTGSPPLAVRLDHATRTWTLYMQDLILAENLPLLTEPGAPRVTVQPGGGPGDLAILKELVLKEPGHRPDNPIKAVNGRIDLAAEHQAGTPGVWMGSKPTQEPGKP